MVSYIQFLTALVLLCGTVFANADNTTITVSTNNTPLDQKVLLEVSEEAFRRLGMQFKLTNLPSERSLQSANVGEVDGEGLRIAGLSENYPNLIQVPEPYIRISFVAFAKDASIKIDGWESLNPYRLAFITGWKMFEAYASEAREVHKVDKPEQLFQMLNLGRIDLALYTLADGIVLTRSLRLSSITPLQPSLNDVDIYLYLNEKHKALVPQVADTIRKMKADGTYDKILSAIRAQ